MFGNRVEALVSLLVSFISAMFQRNFAVLSMMSGENSHLVICSYSVIHSVNSGGGGVSLDVRNSPIDLTSPPPPPELTEHVLAHEIFGYTIWRTLY